MSFIITSSLASVASAAGTVATMAVNPATSQSALRNFEQQNNNWTVKKEHLIYAMCNQLNQFDQTDAQFVEFCIRMLIGQPFSFANLPDNQTLKSLGGHIGSRHTYVTILVALLYSTRKNLSLCQNCMRFIHSLLELDLVKVDFVISKSGLLQVLFNLLRYFSELTELNESKIELVTDMKLMFSLITRLLIRFNEGHELDNFGFYLNSMVSLCYDSANIGYQRFNDNLKSIVLNIVQSIMTDLNTMSSAQGRSEPAGQAVKQNLLKKIITPLISPMQTSSGFPPEESTKFITVFDSDVRFLVYCL